jgi:putative ABC transport system permease protein
MTIVQDLRSGLRLLFRNPGYTAVAALSIGLGIGVNTMTFSGVNSVLLKPIPVEDAARVVSVFTADTRTPTSCGHVAAGLPGRPLQELRVLRDDVGDGAPLALSDTGAQPEIVQGQLVSGDFFDVPGVKVVVGRTFRREEDRTPGTRQVAVLSRDGWQRYFAGDPAVDPLVALRNE